MCHKRFPFPWYIGHKLYTYLVPKLTLSQMDRNDLPLDTCHLGAPLGVPKMISMPKVHSAQTMPLSSAEIYTMSKGTETRFHFNPCHIGVPLVAPKMIFKLMVRSAQTVHLSCIEINTISKQTETICHLKWASTWHASPRSTVGCAQNDFHACGTFGANRAPILCED
jgi:hypothetical protein